ncbi:stage III sporulation protein AF [Alkalithermobacter paradoxus]|uniref:Stage III sporulation protein SpoIIIAF n=1 Tax=Alkalithermobacter paradoxus TaxID=29349 RepID=A0A1V4IAC5_9FIRM|nr:stage III sporulation protein SpoIIIAF [[Clostridium] thermoalcaliphilum]
MDIIKVWISTILIGAFIVNVIELILPSGNLKPYVNLVLSFMFIFIIITPISNFFSKDIPLEDKILQKYSDFQYKYHQSAATLNNVNLKEIETNYFNYLKETLNIKLKDHGYEVDNIEIKDNEVKNLTIREIKFKENSNNESNEEIKLKENESYKEAFKSKESPNEDNLKNELNQIFKISVEKIKIN